MRGLNLPVVTIHPHKVTSFFCGCEDEGYRWIKLDVDDDDDDDEEEDDDNEEDNDDDEEDDDEEKE